MPAEYNNPILIASEILLALSKEFPNDAKSKIPTVLAFGKMIANGATNVIPETVSIAGTFRTMDENWRKQVHEKIKTIATKIATEKNAKAEVKIVSGYPFLVNDEAITNKAKSVAATYLGKENVSELPIRMTAEDFAFISQQVPACFFRLGTGNKKQGITSGVHTATFNVDENAIETGAALLAAMAVELLSE
jgi:amidohydrolase